MSLIIVEPPAGQYVGGLAVTPDECWEQIQAETDGVIPFDIEHIERLIHTATAWLDGADGKLGRALITQTWRAYLPYFPPVIEVPLPPLRSVIAIRYTNVQGSVVTLPSNAYRVSGIGGAGRAEIRAAFGTTWPRTRHDDPEAVEVEFECGYGDSPEDVPAPIRHAIRLLVAHLYEHPEAVVGTSLRDLPYGVLDMIGSYRVWP